MIYHNNLLKEEADLYDEIFGESYKLLDVDENIILLTKKN
jgi:hypothetical protein